MEYDRQIGTSLLMHVMSGDEIQMEVENYYEDYEPFFDFPVDPEDMFDNLILTLVNGEVVRAVITTACTRCFWGTTFLSSKG
jgi:hypothetical protein